MEATNAGQLNTLSSESIKERLLSATIGGQKNSTDLIGQEAQDIFTLYIQKALGNAIEVKDVELLRCKVSLNSIMANAVLVMNGEERKVFLKIHIEANSKNGSAIGDANEYANAELLFNAGWPVLAPLGRNSNPDFPLLIYPRVSAETLFTAIEETYAGKGSISNLDIKIMDKTQEIVGRVTQASLKETSSSNAISSPVQTLFYERFKEGGRIDEWYKDETLFSLPGLGEPITWEKLKKAQWDINGIEYKNAIGEIIASARKSLSFSGEEKAFKVISHGDDHSGNIFLERETGIATLFDPAFAGENPIALSDTKALAHIGYMMMGGMYFDPKIPTCVYSYDSETNTMRVKIDFASTPLFREHEILSRQIIDSRIVPLFIKAKKSGAVLKNEIRRFKDSLSACPLLTINISMLLNANDGRGVGLLPLALMLNDLSGLESLEYLQKKLSEIEN